MKILLAATIILGGVLITKNSYAGLNTSGVTSVSNFSKPTAPIFYAENGAGMVQAYTVCPKGYIVPYEGGLSAFQKPKSAPTGYGAVVPGAN